MRTNEQNKRPCSKKSVPGSPKIFKVLLSLWAQLWFRLRTPQSQGPRSADFRLVLAGDGHRQLFPSDEFPQAVELLADQSVTDIEPVAIDVDDVRLRHFVSPTLSTMLACYITSGPASACALSMSPSSLQRRVILACQPWY